jgi:cholesterol oxidase
MGFVPPRERHYDAVVVGAGFGGCVVTNRLATADKPWRVCLLERGDAHRPGDFPRSPAELKRGFWDPSHGRYGLFDVWSFSGLAAVVASGLGGGSLIFANVLERADEGWLVVDEPDGSCTPWPVSAGQLDEHYTAVLDKLGRPGPYPRSPPFGDTPKTRAFREAARRAGLEVDEDLDEERQPKLGIRFADDHGRVGVRLPFDDPDANWHGVQRRTCEMVGECNLGCNAGAKQSMDLTYLSELKDNEFAEVCTRTEVRGFRPAGDGFEVDFRDHSAGAGTPPRTGTITCSRLVLAAGTFGTTLLMLRNRLALPKLSNRIGWRFNGNGDYLAFAVDCKPDENECEPIQASRGPVITASARSPDRREGGDGPGFHLQDGGFPDWVTWLAQISGVRGDLLRARVQGRRLLQGRLRGDPDTNLSAELSDLLGDGGERVLPILSLGREIPAGRLRLRGRDRRLELDWREDQSAALYERTEAATRQLASELNGRYSDPLRWLRPITVHPLGGCVMGESHETGVVDPWGHVHRIPGLSIADGSVLPGPVGINPALTIAALANRHADSLLESGRPSR